MNHPSLFLLVSRQLQERTRGPSPLFMMGVVQLERCACLCRALCAPWLKADFPTRQVSHYKLQNDKFPRVGGYICVPQTGAPHADTIKPNSTGYGKMSPSPALLLLIFLFLYFFIFVVFIWLLFFGQQPECISTPQEGMDSGRPACCRALQAEPHPLWGFPKSQPHHNPS